MRIAFGVLVVVALLALAAPIAAKIPTEAATQELNEAHNQLIRIVDKPTAWDKIRHRLRKSNPSTVKALRLPQQRPEPSEDIQKALQNLQTAEDTMTKANNEKNRYVREWASVILENQVEEVAKSGLGSLPLVRSPPLASALDGLNLAILWLNRVNVKHYRSDFQRYETWHVISSFFEQAEFAIATVKHRAKGFEQVSAPLRTTINSLQNSLAKGPDANRALMDEIDRLKKRLQPFDTLIHWNTNDAKTVKDALQKVRNAAYKAFPMDARNQRSNDGKEVAQAQA